MCALPKGTDGLRCDDQSLMNTAEALGVTLRTPFACRGYGAGFAAVPCRLPAVVLGAGA